jgi:hypothetical protein
LCDRSGWRILAVKQYSDMCAADWVGAVEGPNCRAVVLENRLQEEGRGNRSNLQCGGRREGNYY